MERRLLDALALGVASGAFVAPTVWLIGVAALCVVASSLAFVLSGHPVVSLPWRAVRRGVELLHPRSLMWLPVLTARTVIGAIVLPAAVAAVVWTTAEGTTGTLAAARAGAWADGFRVGAALLCLMLVSSVGDGRQRRVAGLRRWASRLPNGAVTTLVVASVVVAAVVILAVPHPRDPIAAEADGLGWLPAAARPRADQVRDDIVTAELDVLVACLSRQGGTAWRTSYSSGNPLGQPDVARLTAEGSVVGAPADLATAVMAAHNQLAPWVETIEVSWSGEGVVRTDRTALPRRRPLTDPALLVPATSVGQSWLQASVADRAAVLRCSVGPVL